MFKFYRKKYKEAFAKKAEELIETYDQLEFEKTPCERYYVCKSDWIVITMDKKTGKYMGKKNYDNKYLSEVMKYYQDKKYNMITIDLYKDYKNPKVIIPEDVQTYLDNIKILQK